jgi:Holliday junction resolvase
MKVSHRHRRIKGQRHELAIIRLLQALGLSAERVPLSGSAGGTFGADIIVTFPDCPSPARIEVKCRKDGFRTIEKWLEGVDAVVMGSRVDGDDALIVFRLKDLLEAGGVTVEAA